jgi:hypothetical protein
MMRALNRQTISYIKKINKKLSKKQLLVLVPCKKTILHFVFVYFIVNIIVIETMYVQLFFVIRSLSW